MHYKTYGNKTNVKPRIVYAKTKPTILSQVPLISCVDNQYSYGLQLGLKGSRKEKFFFLFSYIGEVILYLFFNWVRRMHRDVCHI